MARQVRIEYPGALYHVFSRGNQKQAIFLSDEDRCFYLNCLRKAHERFGVVVHVYCLMPNHYHLILETPLGNLSKMMHSLITSYTVYFNKKHKRPGHLFQGRFKAILIEAVDYARELSRYIHLNPVKAGIVKRPELFAWSSYGFYQGRTLPESWIETAAFLKLFGDDPAESRIAYHDFVITGIGKEAPGALKESMRIGILGSEEFIARIKREYLAEEIVRPDREKPQIRRLRPRLDPSVVLSIGEKILGPRNKYLIPIAIFVCHNNSALKLKEIGEFFSLSISSVSNACLKAKTAIATNEALGKAVATIEELLRERTGKG